MRLLLLLAALVAAPAAAAQAPADTLRLTPGDGVLTTDWLAPGTAEYTIRLVQPMQQAVGTATETVAIEDGVVTRTTVTEIAMQGLTQRDSLVADAATLTPFAHVSTGGPTDTSLEFMAEGVVGLITPRQGAATTVLLMTDAPVFDMAWMGEVAQSLPLEAGLVARAEGFASQSPEETVAALFSVGEAETVDGRTVLPVTVTMGPLTMVHRIDPATRALVSTQFTPREGFVVEIAPASE